MLVAPKFNGLDLPFHDPDTPVALRGSMSSQGIGEITEDFTLPTFVRATEIILRSLSHAPRSAAELLEKTDRELKKVAELCNARVVEYEWGLYPVDPTQHAYRRLLPAHQGLGPNVRLPKNHILVAEVQTIQAVPFGMGDEAFLERQAKALKAMGTGVLKYYEEGQGTYQLFDFRDRHDKPRINQFMLGAPIGTLDDQIEMRMTDIEPRFALTR